MKFVLVIEIILSINSAIFPASDAFEKKDPFKHYLDKVRCTRRYSVGDCPDSVVPVWTYVPHLQNCTERLGCPFATISNRFPTREQCMRKCRSLKDMYTMLLAETNLTNSGLRSSWVNIGRRDDDGQSDAEPEYPAAPAYRDSDDDPPAQFHTEPVTPQDTYDEVPPEVEFWEGR